MSDKMNATGRKFMVEWRHVALIDREIRGGSYPSAPQMADMLELSTRTVKRRIEFMRYDLGAPIEYDASKKGYYYREDDWLLPPIKVSEGELFAVVVAERALRGLKNNPMADRLEKVFEKIAMQLPEEVEVDPAELAQGIGFAEGPQHAPDARMVDALGKAVQDCRRVEMDYYKLSADKTVQRTVDPLMLRCVEGEWYLVGRAHETGYVSLFHMGRIGEYEVTDEGFDRDGIDFDPDTYFQDSFEAGHGGERVEASIRFTGWAARYIAEREWHPEQELKKKPGGDVVLSLPVGWLEEIKSWVLSYGRKAEVLEPPALRQRVAEELNAAANHYTDE